MPKNKQNAKKDRVALYVLVPQEVHELLQNLSFLEGRTLSDLTRAALDEYVERHRPSREDIERVVQRLRKVTASAAPSSPPRT